MTCLMLTEEQLAVVQLKEIVLVIICHNCTIPILSYFFFQILLTFNGPYVTSTSKPKSVLVVWAEYGFLANLRREFLWLPEQ